MAQIGKASGKRGKPTYAYAIIGVALVLFLFGIVGWFFLNLRKTGDYLKESIQVHAFLSPTASKKQIDSVVNYINAIPYANRIEYVTKEKAIEKYNAENDTTWKKIIDANPLPESIDFFIKADYVQEDSLNILSTNLHTNFPGVISEFQFPTATVTKISKYVKIGGIIFLIAAAILTILVVFSIDNTIRLAMYSNRFLIKTMQMVGATRGFIARPINQRAILNGFISACIAIFCIWVSIMAIESIIPDFKVLRDTQGLMVLFLVIIVLGITISLASTHRAVIKYLKMKLDDLY
ncbi:MAG TPA: permease-like cell division protein FtsX [Ferruginibacter sp.]|jgi:cell division transport system permease protein|nr:permease-like cell division protein FtsX [Ferruginibacter sp.]HRO05147.1 permease-like cell division protein FtsX [Ferruginibacter sp.]HRO95548.1 permease-like cell division protein FtsX [Ferruginibacter sp.]HRP50645.1 permease-like cell division protein FtsX [Ferruginibacter sp.]